MPQRAREIPRDEEIEPGGKPGQLFFYRPGEVLIRSVDRQRVEGVLGPNNANGIAGDDDRSLQRQNKRLRPTQPSPFGVMVFHYIGPDNPNKQSVPEALEALRSASPPIEADYNYVTARSPMRSHAVSYAEPADPADIKPTFIPPKFVEPELAPPQPDDAAEFRVAVLDTGRPYYSEKFRDYFLKRLEDPEKLARAVSRGISATTPVHPVVPSLDETNVMFEPKGSAARDLAPVARSDAPTAVVGDDQDTMVTNFGRLAHPHAGHGIFVSSIVARHAPGVTIVAEATMSYDAIGDMYDMLVDIEHAIEVSCRLLNMSLGFHTELDVCPTFLKEALDKLETDDGLLVASAGNDGGSRPTWPAAYEKVVAVAATDRYGTPTDWSNFGDWVDVCAYGNDVVSHYPFADWDFPDGTAKRFHGAARWSGTSFSAPLVTAMIAQEVMTNGGPPRTAWEKLKTKTIAKDEHNVDIPSHYGGRLGPLPSENGGESADPHT